MPKHDATYGEKLEASKREAQEVLVRFLKAWIQQNYPVAYEAAQATWRSNAAHTLVALSDLLSQKKLQAFQVLKMQLQGNCGFVCCVRFTLEDGSREISNNIMVILENRAYEPVNFEAAESRSSWGVNPFSLFRNITKNPANNWVNAEKLPFEKRKKGHRVKSKGKLKEYITLD